MDPLAIGISVALAVLLAVLAVLQAASFRALVKGSFELHRGLRTSCNDFDGVLLKSPLVPGVSVVLAVPDASPESRALVRRLLGLHFGRHELVLVLDGPPQAALDRWIQEFHLTAQERIAPGTLPSAPIRAYYVSEDPIQLVVVVKEPGGLSDAINAGVNAAQYPVIGLVDPDADFIPEVLLRLICPMLRDWDRTAAVCGVAPAPPVPGLAGAIGTIESLRLWLARCGALGAWNKLLPVPGAFTLVKRDAVRAVGGFRTGPVGLFLDLHAARGGRPGGRVALVAQPVSFRHPAASWRELRLQVRRDQRQLASAMRRLRAGSGIFLGLLCIRGLRPVVETAAYLLAAAGWATGMVHPALAALAPALGIGGGIVISMTAVVMGELARPSGMGPGALAMLVLAAIPENTGYRQRRNLWLMGGFFGGSGA